MLLRFQASNYRSVKDPVELSLIAVDEDRPAARPFPSLNARVLTIAGIYGPNASGKSNVIEALAWLAGAVRYSLRLWDAGVPREPFKFADGPSMPSTFEVEMVVNTVRYAYQLEVNDSEVRFEALYSYPERRRRTLFVRDGEVLHGRRGLGGLAGTRELLTPTTLALSAAVRLGEDELRSFGRALGGMDVLGLRRRGRSAVPTIGAGGAFSSTARLFDEEPDPAPARLFEDDVELGPIDNRESALALLRFADLGIDDVRMLADADIDDAKSTRTSQARRDVRSQLRFIHRAVAEEIPFRLDEESAGTRTWFDLIGPTLGALRRGRILLFDEIDASLHPRLSARLLELFQDPFTNPRGAQLVFTTHDTSLLNHLNRDEVWLTDKDASGATSLTALAEFGGEKVRRSLNLEKAYLQGRFGAVPELDQHVVRRALGLAADG